MKPKDQHLNMVIGKTNQRQETNLLFETKRQRWVVMVLLWIMYDFDVWDDDNSSGEDDCDNDENDKYNDSDHNKSDSES